VSLGTRWTRDASRSVRANQPLGASRAHIDFDRRGTTRAGEQGDAAGHGCVDEPVSNCHPAMLPPRPENVNHGPDHCPACTPAS